MTSPRVALDRELAQLESEVLALGSMVEKAIARSVDALRTRNEELSRQVIRDDDLIDAKRAAIEEHAIDVIAMQQPLAGDLRQIVTTLHVVVELERMGDYAEGIGKIGLMMDEEPPLKPVNDIPRMADLATAMLHKSLDALVNRDVELARQTALDDDVVDALYDDVYGELVMIMVEDRKTIERATHLLWAAHDLERVADRATNVAEQVVYLVTGTFEEINASRY